jgi:hypothetical protein
MRNALARTAARNVAFCPSVSVPLVESESNFEAKILLLTKYVKGLTLIKYSIYVAKILSAIRHAIMGALPPARLLMMIIIFSLRNSLQEIWGDLGSNLYP